MNPQQNPSSKNPAVMSILAIGVIAIAVVGVIMLRRQDDSVATETTSRVGESSETATASNSTNPTTGDYKSGSYSATGSYQSPGGTEQVAVSVTLDGNTITAATVTPKAASPTSVQYQGEFVDGFKALVIGKDIDQVELSKVSGSSLTSRGFNDALEQIKDQAGS